MNASPEPAAGEAVLALPEPPPEPPLPESPPEPSPTPSKEPQPRVSQRLQKLLEEVLTEIETRGSDPALLKHIDTLARAMTAVCLLAEKEYQLDDAAPRPIDDARRHALARRIELLRRQWQREQAGPGADGG